LINSPNTPNVNVNIYNGILRLSLPTLTVLFQTNARGKHDNPPIANITYIINTSEKFFENEYLHMKNINEPNCEN
jgi:hypothetical protein